MSKFKKVTGLLLVVFVLVTLGGIPASGISVVVAERMDDANNARAVAELIRHKISGDMPQ